MIVCQCKGVTDRQIRRAVREGARSRSEVVLACSAGLSCGGCAPAVDAIIDREIQGSSTPSLLGLPELATG